MNKSMHDQLATILAVVLAKQFNQFSFYITSHLVDVAIIDKLLDEQFTFFLAKGVWEKRHAMRCELCCHARTVCR